MNGIYGMHVGGWMSVYEFGVLCCLTTPGLRKDIRRQMSVYE